MAHFAGWQKHLHLFAESVWGEFPGGAGIYLPYAEYDVRPRVVTNQASLFTGLRQRRHHRIVRATLNGRLECPLFSYHAAGKSIAEHLIGWLLSAPNELQLDSFSCKLFESGADDKLHLGLRPSSGSISGGAESPSIRISLQLEGREEQGGVAVPALSSASPRPTEFLFKDVVFSLGGQPVELRSFEIRVNNRLEVAHNNSYWPSLVTAGVREVEFQFSVFKTDDVFDAMRRTPPEDLTAQLVLKGAHDGTGPVGTNYTVATFQFDRLGFQDANETGSLDELVGQDVEMIVLKPSTAADEIQATFTAVE